MLSRDKAKEHIAPAKHDSTNSQPVFNGLLLTIDYIDDIYSNADAAQAVAILTICSLLSLFIQECSECQLQT